MTEELRDPATAAAVASGSARETTAIPPRFPWHVLAFVAFLTLAGIAAGIYIVRQSPALPALPARPPGGSSVAPIMPQAPGAPETDATKPGTLGIAKTQCQGFADIAARFWDLRNEGRTLEFAFDVIDKNSAGDEKKSRMLKALAQVVYKNDKLTRDAAYRNAFEACLKQ